MKPKIVHVDSIPNLNNTFLNDIEKKELQQEFNDILFYGQDKDEPSIEPDTILTFTEGYLYHLHGIEQIDYAHVFLTDSDPENGNVGYEIITDNLDRLGMSVIDATRSALWFLYSPIISSKGNFHHIFNINKDHFFHVHNREFSDNMTGFTYESSEQIKHETDSIEQADPTYNHITHYGIVIIYA